MTAGGAKPALADELPANERHYKPAEIARMWNISEPEVRRIFGREPGVIAIGEPRPKFGRRRGKVTLRIPQSVLDRVRRRLDASRFGGPIFGPGC